MRRKRRASSPPTSPAATAFTKGLAIAVAAAGSVRRGGRLGVLDRSARARRRRDRRPIRRRPPTAPAQSGELAAELARRHRVRARLLALLLRARSAPSRQRSSFRFVRSGPRRATLCFTRAGAEARASCARTAASSHVDDLNVDSAVTVFPEGAVGDAQSQATLIRLPDGIAGTRARLHRVFATLHARRLSRRALSRRRQSSCSVPCHQSVFDVVDERRGGLGPGGSRAAAAADRESARDGTSARDRRLPRARSGRLLGRAHDRVERFLLWVDDRLGTAHFLRARAAQSVSRSLVVHARRDQPVRVRRAAGDRHVSRLLLRSERREDDLSTDRTGCSTACTCRTRIASALALSFEVNCGLLVRQIHHWAALRLRRRHRRCTWGASSSPARFASRARSIG